MKKLILASAIAAISATAAQAAPTVYGKAFVTIDYVDVDFDGISYQLNPLTNTLVTVNEDLDESTTQINSNGSKVGFRGAEALTGSTDAIYQLEYGLAIDGESRELKARDTYLGLENDTFGQVRVGRNTSTIDYVNNVTVTKGYWDNLGNNKIDEEKKNVQALNMQDSGRINNSIVWISPEYQSFQLALMYGADEDFGSSDDGFGAALTFDQGTGFTAGIAYDDDLGIDGGGDMLRGTVTFDVSTVSNMPLTLGALYQKTDFDLTSEDEKGFIISAELGLDNFAKPASIYAQYNNTSDLNGLKDADSDQFVVGGKYMYRDNIIAHGYVGYNKADDARTIGGTLPDTDLVVADTKVFNVGAGLEYKF